MPKRPHGDSGHYAPQPHKKQRDSCGGDALSQLPQQTSSLATVSTKNDFAVHVPPRLPPLPPIAEQYSHAPFRHKSAHHTSRSVATNDLTYERLEFLGDAYLELFASRLIYARFFHLPAGHMSQLRELLIKNETLAEYGRAYGFDKRVEVMHMEAMQKDAKKGNKGLNKIIGDVFEAYVAAIVLSDDERGYSTAEKWMVSLWAPKLVEAGKSDRSYAPAVDGKDLRQTYDPNAKGLLQKRICGSSKIKLQYEPYRDSVELKGDKIGQNRHYIALYLTGYGYERKELGRAEGKNKVEAGNWAAIEAMYGDAKEIVDECEEKRIRNKEEWERLKAEKDASGKEWEKQKADKEAKLSNGSPNDRASMSSAGGGRPTDGEAKDREEKS